MMPYVSLALTESEKPATGLSFWEWELGDFLREETPDARSFFSKVTRKNWIRRLWKLDVKSPCHGATSSTRRIHMMTRHPSRAEVVPESACRAPKVMWQVGAAIFSHPDSDM